MSIADLTEHDIMDIRNRLFAQSLGNDTIAQLVADLDACSNHAEHQAVLTLWTEQIEAQFKQVFVYMNDLFTKEGAHMTTDETQATDTPKCRYAHARRDVTDWQITLCYDYLPLGATITYEYMGDYFLPVVWDTLPATKADQEAVAYQISEVALAGIFTTAHYRTGDDHALYTVDAQGYEHLLCVASDRRVIGEIAHAMNATFPGCDTSAYHEAEREKARAHFATFRIGREG